MRVDLVGEEEDATVLIRDMAACEGAIERGGWDAGAIERVVRAPRAQRAIAGAWDETRGGELVGYAVCVGDGTLVATIERVCVREDMRGRGIGRGLVHALGEKMFEREIYDVGVRAPVSHRNNVARAHAEAVALADRDARKSDGGARLRSNAAADTAPDGQSDGSSGLLLLHRRLRRLYGGVDDPGLLEWKR